MERPVIGMSFSGGGYRAATFDLGVLSLLNSVKMKDEEGEYTLLDCVAALSSVSGGTIPAMKYMLTRAQGKDVGQMVDELFGFLRNQDLMGEALKRLSAGKADPELSAIKIMAGVYDELLFGHKDLGVIMKSMEDEKFPVKDYTALATDFDNSLPFRFRLCAGTMTKWTGGGLSYAVFGNNDHRIGRDDASRITPGEALACSSCFPSGFEPMMFPDDFKLSQDEKLAAKYRPGFGIMDGGVSDNQGIESVLKAEERLRKHRADKSRKDKALDLIIVSDVASPYMKEGYRPVKALSRWFGKLTLGRLRNYGLIGAGLSVALLALALLKGSAFWSGVMAVVTAGVGLLNLAGYLLKKKMYSFLGGTFVKDRAGFISHLKMSTAWSLLMNRANSVVMMSSEVFLKRLRQLAYDSLYGDKDWNNRVITNTVYSLREGERWTTRPADLAPSAEMQAVSAQAADMGTTLWFTDEDIAQGMPEALFAAGQYTICYNLLYYIERIKKSQSNLTPAHQAIIGLEGQLLKMWNQFKTDPKCKVPKV